MRRVSIAMGLVAAISAAPAVATVASTTLTVSAVIKPSCKVQASPIDFAGTEDNAATRAGGTIDLTCTPDTGYSVAIDSGRNASGAQRRMIGESIEGFLAYEIYTDAALTRPWSSGAAGAVSGVAPRSGKRVSIPTFARVVSSTARAGRYADVVTVTIEF